MLLNMKLVQVKVPLARDVRTPLSYTKRREVQSFPPSGFSLADPRRLLINTSFCLNRLVPDHHQRHRHMEENEIVEVRMLRSSEEKKCINTKCFGFKIRTGYQLSSLRFLFLLSFPS
jgi:hypothetical protein